MKVSISYCPGEEEQAEAVLEAAKVHMPNSRVRNGIPKPPYEHIFITTPRPENIGPLENG